MIACYFSRKDPRVCTDECWLVELELELVVEVVGVGVGVGLGARAGGD